MVTTLPISAARVLARVSRSLLDLLNQGFDVGVGDLRLVALNFDRAIVG
jgi:hypothetical protein